MLFANLDILAPATVNIDVILSIYRVKIKVLILWKSGKLELK